METLKLETITIAYDANGIPITPGDIVFYPSSSGVFAQGKIREIQELRLTEVGRTDYTVAQTLVFLGPKKAKETHQVIKMNSLAFPIQRVVDCLDSIDMKKLSDEDLESYRNLLGNEKLEAERELYKRGK